MARVIYATLNDFRRRVREEILIACLDFDGDEEPDENIFLGAIAEPACTDIDRQLAGVFKGQVPFAAAPDTPETIKELALDYYSLRLGTMFKSHAHIDVGPLLAKIQSDLKRLREGLDIVGVAPPDAATNTGGAVGAIGNDPPIDPPDSMFDDMGDFSPS